MANERVVTVQGIDVPASSIGTRETDQLYYGLTRRQIRQAKPLTSFAGVGNSDEFQLIHDGIVAALIIRVTGTIVGVGTAATSGRRWPYDILRGIRFSANGQTNLVNCSGLKAKALQFMQPDDSDKGVTPLGGVAGTPARVGIGGANPGFSVDVPTALTQSGYLSDTIDRWGFGSGCSGIAAGTYPVDLHFFIPVAYDQKTLEGAIFAQTEGTNLVLSLDWANQSDVFPTAFGTSTTFNLQFSVHEVYFDIPIVGGKRLLPSGIQYFHQLVQTRATTAIAQGDNEFILPGVARGRKLMRVFYQLWNGAASAPVVPADSSNVQNFGPQGWIYGGNQNPERWALGVDLAFANERIFNADLASQWGFLCHDFANEWAFRDLVDLGSTNDIRLLMNLTTNVALSAPIWEVVQQVLVGGPTPQA
jgi:hypothetical protein